MIVSKQSPGVHPLLSQALEMAGSFLDGLPQRHVGGSADWDKLISDLGGPLPDEGEDPARMLSHLAEAIEPGLVATAGPRYFGFVIGGSLPATVATDWMTAAWDQNAGLLAASPAAAAAEEVAALWILDVLGLPSGAAVGLVTGGQMANFTCLAAARHEMLRRAGWDVERRGLRGSPALSVIAGAEAHATIESSLRMLGLGDEWIKIVPSDSQGRMDPVELRRTLERVNGPSIVCAQAGNVNTGAFDPFGEIAPAVRAREGWLHVDGAFGLWAAASPALKHHLTGVALADSWAVDAHKWLNVPHDCGIAITNHPEAQRSSMTVGAPYLIKKGKTERDPLDWVPESSRRARGFTVYAALKTLGRRGLADLVERCCRHARLMAERLSRAERIEILNEVVLNQVLVRFVPPSGADATRFTDAVISRVQRDGTCWAGGTTWHGLRAMRISVCNWSTSEADIERSAEAILKAAREEAGA